MVKGKWEVKKCKKILLNLSYCKENGNGPHKKIEQKEEDKKGKSMKKEG